MSENTKIPLLRASREVYKGPYDEHLLELYKILVSSAERISQQRTSANNYLLSVNAFLLTVYGFASALQPEGNWNVAVPLAGSFVCVGWWVLIRSYRNVNSAKFDVIHELEEELPARPYAREWELMKKTHIPLSHVEQWIPAVFGTLYLGLWLLSCS